MVDMYFEFTELCTTIPPLEYGGNELLLETFASKVRKKGGSLLSRLPDEIHCGMFSYDRCKFSSNTIETLDSRWHSENLEYVKH